MRSEYGDLRTSGVGGGCGMSVKRRTRSPARNMFGNEEEEATADFK
jgi:hypothetical protein